MDHNGHLQSDDIIRGVRQRRKQTDPVACPVCGITVRPADIEQHYAVEMERLHKLHISDAGQRAAKSAATSAVRSPSSAGNSGRASSDAAGCSTSAMLSASAAAAASSSTPATGANPTKSGVAAANGAAAIDPKECWSTYQRIKNNRQSRLKTKSRKRKIDDTICPVCNEYVADDITIHVEMCLRRNDTCGRSHHNGHHSNAATAAAMGGTSTTAAAATSTRTAGSDDDDDDDISIDVESEPFEEYEWAGQTRIRASSLLQGGYGAAGVGTAMQCAAAGDEDEDLNVDGDDSHVFGESQYGERDVIVPSASSNKEQTEILYLRKLVSGDSGLTAAGGASSSTASNGADQRMDVAEAATATEPCDADPSQSPLLSGGSKDAIIESLKIRLREYESHQRLQNKCKCLICMDEFRIPVVSICCWHVHCEECWLRTLGARKLCPQCNMITSPADLRRIYM